MPIKEGEVIWYSSTGQHFGYTGGTYTGDGNIGAYSGHYSGEHSSDRWTQCNWCYNQWLNELAMQREWWKKWWKRWWLGFCILFVLYMIFLFSYVYSKPESERGEFSILYAILGIGFQCLLSWLIGLGVGKIFQPKVNRYRFRQRPN